MHKHFKISLFVCIMLGVISIFCVHAAEETSEKYKNSIYTANYQDCSKYFTKVLNGFETVDPFFNISGDIKGSYTEKVDVYPYSPFEGKYAYKAWFDVGENRSSFLSIQASDFIEVERDCSLFLALNLESVASSVFLNVIVETESSISVHSFLVTPEGWNGVLVPIRKEEAGKGIQRINMELLVEGSYQGQLTYYLDSLALCEGLSAEKIYYLSDAYQGNGNINFSAEGMVLDVLGPETTIFCKEMDLLLDTNTNALELKVDNSSSAEYVTLYYQTATDSDFSEDKKYEAELVPQTNAQSVYFPLGPTSIKALKFVFHGGTAGEKIVIKRILLASVFEEGKTYGGHVTGCHLSSDRETILIKGEVDQAQLEFLPEGSVIALYEVDSYPLQTEEEPIAQIPLSKEFEFQIPLYEEGISRLYSGFILQIETPDGARIALNSVSYITNPEMLASVSWNYPTMPSIKGTLSGVSSAFENAATQTVVNVDYGKLLTFDENGYTYEYEGDKFYFNRNYLGSLDQTIKEYWESGIAVGMRILYSPSEADAVLLTATAEPEKTAIFYAMNAETEEGITYLKAITTFLVQRYSMEKAENGRVLFYIVGNDVNSSLFYNNMGQVYLNHYVDQYANVFRLIYNTIKSHCAVARVFVPIDCNWDRGLSASDDGLFDARSFLEVFNNQISAQGNINWNLLVNPDGREKWISHTDVLCSSTIRISSGNIEKLCEYMEESSLCYIGVPRRILLCSGAQSSAYYDSSEEYAAEYAYMYIKVNNRICETIDGYIVARIPIYKEIFKYIDTENFENVTNFALSYIGIQTWEEILKGFNRSSCVKRELTEISMTGDVPDNIVGSIPLWDFSEEDEIAWKNGAYCTSLSFGESYMNKSDVLLVQFSSSDFSEQKSFVYIPKNTVDLSATPYLQFSVFVSAASPEKSQVNFTVYMESGEQRLEGNISLLCGQWNYIILDITGFSSIKNIENIRFSLDGGEGSESIALSEIIGLSTVYTNEELKLAVKGGVIQRDTDSSGAGILVSSLILVIILSISGIVYNRFRMGLKK